LILHRNHGNSAVIESTSIDPTNERGHKNLKDINLGFGVHKELDSNGDEDRK
jgi:hypothetical protein